MSFRSFIGLFLAAGVLLLGLVSQPAQAQLIQGSLTGNVTDPTGAAIPGAVVSVLNTQTGRTRETITNSAGQYRFPTLAAGTYLISFSVHSADHKRNYHRIDNRYPVVVEGGKAVDGVCYLPTEWTVAS